VSPSQPAEKPSPAAVQTTVSPPQPAAKASPAAVQAAVSAPSPAAQQSTVVPPSQQQQQQQPRSAVVVAGAGVVSTPPPFPNPADVSMGSSNAGAAEEAIGFFERLDEQARRGAEQSQSQTQAHAAHRPLHALAPAAPAAARSPQPPAAASVASPPSPAVAKATPVQQQPAASPVAHQLSVQVDSHAVAGIEDADGSLSPLGEAELKLAADVLGDELAAEMLGRPRAPSQVSQPSQPSADASSPPLVTRHDPHSKVLGGAAPRDSASSGASAPVADAPASRGSHGSDTGAAASPAGGLRSRPHSEPEAPAPGGDESSSSQDGSSPAGVAAGAAAGPAHVPQSHAHALPPAQASTPVRGPPRTPASMFVASQVASGGPQSPASLNVSQMDVNTAVLQQAHVDLRTLCDVLSSVRVDDGDNASESLLRRCWSLANSASVRVAGALTQADEYQSPALGGMSTPQFSRTGSLAHAPSSTAVSVAAARATQLEDRVHALEREVRCARAVCCCMAG
jgi:hypothetical protein